MKIFVAALALASVIATSAVAKTEGQVAARATAFTLFKADRVAAVVARSGQAFALMLGVAF